MTEQERLERISEGKLWNDTDEYLAHQAKVKDLMYSLICQNQVKQRKEPD